MVTMMMVAKKQTYEMKTKLINMLMDVKKNIYS